MRFGVNKSLGNPPPPWRRFLRILFEKDLKVRRRNCPRVLKFPRSFKSPKNKIWGGRNWGPLHPLPYRGNVLWIAWNSVQNWSDTFLPSPSQTCAPKKFRWCWWEAEWRVKHAQTWEQGPPSAPAECIIVLWQYCWSLPEYYWTANRGHIFSQEISTVLSALKPVLLNCDVIHNCNVEFSMGFVFIM